MVSQVVLFQPQRGVRQGCPLSPYLFILAAEVLAKTIRSNKNIDGFFLGNNEVKLSQYADDTRGGCKGGPKTAKPHQVCQIAANRTEFYQKTETADTNEGYGKSPPS